MGTAMKIEGFEAACRSKGGLELSVKRPITERHVRAVRGTGKKRSHLIEVIYRLRFSNTEEWHRMTDAFGLHDTGVAMAERSVRAFLFATDAEACLTFPWLKNAGLPRMQRLRRMRTERAEPEQAE